MLRNVLSNMIDFNGGGNYGFHSFPPLPLDIEYFNWMYVEGNEVKHKNIPVAVIYCDSVSWDGEKNTRNNNGHGSKSYPFRNFFNALANARYLVENFCNLRVKVVVSGVVDYDIKLGVYANDRGYNNAEKIVFDWSACTLKDDIHINIFKAYHVGINTKKISNYNPCVYENCTFTDEGRFGGCYMNNCNISSSGDFSCKKVFNSSISLSGYLHPFAPIYYITYFSVEAAVNCNIKCDSRISEAYVTGELINCTENFPKNS